MKNLKKIVLPIAILVLFYFFYKNFFTRSMIVGEYINRNYNYTPFVAEIPYEGDTLRLLKNNQFTSRFWGEGTYKISYGFSGTKISLSYKDKFGKGIFEGSLTRLYFGKPKLLLEISQNHYMEKR